MIKNIGLLILLLVGFGAFAQENVYPAKEYKGLLFIKNGNIHVGNGQVIENGTIKVNNGKIEEVGTNIAIPADDVKVIDAKGKQVYPGLLLSISNLGLVEVPSVRSTVDATELGEMNPNIRSIVAYNTDSKVINTLKSNGVLMANIVPNGKLVTGSY